LPLCKALHNGKTHIALAPGYQACQAGIKTLFTTAMNLINHLSVSLADNSFLKTMKLYKSPPSSSLLMS